LLLSRIDNGILKEIGVGVVTLEFKYFRDEASPGPPLDMHQNFERVADVRFDCSKAKVRPETTMATRESPRAMVLVNACCKTLTAFSQGEFACANAGAVRKSPSKEARTRRPERIRRWAMTQSFFISYLGT